MVNYYVHFTFWTTIVVSLYMCQEEKCTSFANQKLHFSPLSIHCLKYTELKIPIFLTVESQLISYCHDNKNDSKKIYNISSGPMLPAQYHLFLHQGASVGVIL